MSKPGYARLLPRLRVLKSQLSKSEDIKSLLLVETFEEALRDAGELKIAKERQLSGDLGEVEAELRRIICGYATEVEKHSPPEAALIAKGFVAEFFLSDLAAAARRVLAKSGLRRDTLVTSRCPGSPLSMLEEDVDSVSRVFETIRDPVLKQIASRMIDAYQATGDPNIMDWIARLSRAYLVQEALSKMDKMGRDSVEAVVCPDILYRLLSGVFYAAMSGLNVQWLDHAYKGVKVCGFNWRTIRQVYESAGGDVEQLLGELRRLYPVLEGKTVWEALENARSHGLRVSRAKALALFAGYPFHAGLVAATLALLEQEASDITAVLAGKKYKLHADSVETILSREV